MIKYTVTNLTGCSIKLAFKGKTTFPNEYIRLREECWVSKLKMHKGNLWNGDVYTIGNIQKSKDNKKFEITMGLCEYKDIVYKISVGPEKIISTFGEEYLMKDAITTVLPYTTDYKFLFGVVSNNTIQENGALDQIGGTLNKDEKIIEKIEDIAGYTAMEMEEEIGFQRSSDKLLSLDSLNYYYEDGRYRFLYLLKLPYDSQYYDRMVVNNELSGVRFMSKDELLNYSGPTTNRIPFCKENIKSIIDSLRKIRIR